MMDFFFFTCGIVLGLSVGTDLFLDLVNFLAKLLDLLGNVGSTLITLVFLSHFYWFLL